MFHLMSCFHGSARVMCDISCDISCHVEDLWHGSGRNSGTRPRRSIGIHLLRSDAEFRRDAPITYIYGRYKLADSYTLREEFFPTVK